MKYKVKPPDNSRTFSGCEAAAFLASWYRVAAADGSTAAYAPDRVTAEVIADALSAAERKPVRP